MAAEGVVDTEEVNGPMILDLHYTWQDGDHTHHDMLQRVWFDQLPDARYPAARTLEVRMPAEPRAHVPHRQAALEWRTIRGGHPSSYGLLGATFTPDPSDTLTIQVALATEDDRWLDWTLITVPLDEVQRGIPYLWEGEAVLGSAGETAAPALGSGTLLFDCAAYGHVGSSPWVFYRLARGVVHFLSADSSSVTEERAKDYLRDLFSREPVSTNGQHR